MITNATQDQVKQAVQDVSAFIYNGNVIVKEMKQLSKNRVQFTIRVKDSRGLGAARSGSGRRTVSACWHAHGHVFDRLFTVVAPTSSDGRLTFVQSMGKKITKDGGNWQDSMRGSNAAPIRASQCCECSKVAMGQEIEKMMKDPEAYI
jgi:hypothetical protein